MRNKVKEEFQQLSELIRNANKLVNPEDSLAYLLKKDIRDRLYGEKPKCFMRLPQIGQDTSPYLLPICNRLGQEDPKIINVSLKMVQKLMDDPSGKHDINTLNSLLSRLQHKQNTFIKNVPKPANMAAKKAKVTRMFQKIKQYLDMNKTSAIGDEKVND